MGPLCRVQDSAVVGTLPGMSSHASSTEPLSKTAVTVVPVSDLVAERWSPRAFDADHRIGDDSLTALLEAARWAASSSNSQPWRFVVGRRGDAVHDTLFQTLADGNKTWAGSAAVLILAVARTERDDGSALSHSTYDLGGAVAQMVLEATNRGLHVHQMAGFSADDAAEALGIESPFRPLTMIAVGRRTTPDTLGEELAERETADRERLPLTEIAFAEWQVPLDL